MLLSFSDRFSWFGITRLYGGKEKGGNKEKFENVLIRFLIKCHRLVSCGFLSSCIMCNVAARYQ